MEKIYAAYTAYFKDIHPDGTKAHEGMRVGMSVRNKYQPVIIMEEYQDGSKTIYAYARESLWNTKEGAEQWIQEEEAKAQEEEAKAIS